MKKTIKRKINTSISSYNTASMMGLHLVSCPAVGAGLGWLADSFFLSNPIGLIIGLILGVITGYMNIRIDSKRLEEQLKKKDILQENEEKERKYREENPHDFIEYGLFGKEKKINLREEKEK